MFTGIVTDVGTVRSAEQRGDLRLTIACGYDMASVELGASIACSGVCLTVVDKGGDWFAVDVSGETLSRTAQGLWREGARLNLERALRLGDELGGHIVTGHVDGLGFVSWGAIENGSIRFSIKAPKRLAAAITEKGSIAINGISLTVNEVDDREDGTYFGVNVIPHTAQNTAMFDRGETVNLEIDVLARYIERMLSFRSH
ncbi:MAG: riboflavin synthase [Sphingomonas sp.]|nr:riboflavin synthase [Sphingomonas sp.]